MEQKLYDAASKLPETSLDFETIKSMPKEKKNIKIWKATASIAACLILLISIGFITVEAKEYNDAIKFFKEYDLPTEGLSRGEIKAVYKDIRTKSFTHANTADVITNSLSADQIEGYEIIQENPTPEDIENIWNYKTGELPIILQPFLKPDKQGIHFEYRSEYKKDDRLGFDIHDKSFIEKYDGATLLWSVSVSEFWINDYSVVSDGVIAFGETPTWSSTQRDYAWMVKVDSNGNLVWKNKLDNGFEDEYIAEILENTDGSYAVISRGDHKCFCLSQYSTDGDRIFFKKTEIGNYGIWNAARFRDGYIVQLGSHMTNEYSNIVKVDYEGNITESFSYSEEDAYYYITDMIEYNDNIYLSAYSVPKLEDNVPSIDNRDELANILNYLFSNDIYDISNEELTPMVRDNYTAMLLICDPNTGTPKEFYSVKGSLGGKLSLSNSGNLLWDAESITTTFFSPATSSFTIGGTSYVFRYTFDACGKLVSQEKTGEVVNFRR